MGTRCNVSVRLSNESTIIFYRHWDGYPAVTGADIARTALKVLRDKPTNYSRMGGGAALACALMAKRRGGDKTYDGGHNWKKPQYELTEAEHGDIEYHYKFDASWQSDSATGMTVRVESGWGDDKGALNFDSVEDFVTLYVNPEIRATNKRIRELGREPKPYQYPEVRLPKKKTR